LRSIILQRLERAKAQVAADLLQLHVQILIEIKSVSIGAFLFKGLEVLLVLSDYVWFLSKNASGLEVQNLTSEMGSRDKVLHFVIGIHSVSESQELVTIVHSAERHVTAHLYGPYHVLRPCCHQSLSLQLYSHGCDVFHEPLGQLLHIFLRLIGRDGQQRDRL